MRVLHGVCYLSKCMCDLDKPLSCSALSKEEHWEQMTLRILLRKILEVRIRIRKCAKLHSP